MKNTIILSNNKKDIEIAINLLKQGKIVCFKTDTIYGFSCDARNENACKEIIKIKGRDNKPMILLAKNKDIVFDCIVNISTNAKKIATNLWPGPLTIIFNTKKIFCNEITAGKTTVAFRVPKDNLCNSILDELDFPIVSTSANLSGEKSLNTVVDILKVFNGKIDAIIDSGDANNCIASTICDATTNDIKVVREGSVSSLDILNSIN